MPSVGNAGKSYAETLSGAVADVDHASVNRPTASSSEGRLERMYEPDSGGKCHRTIDRVLGIG